MAKTPAAALKFMDALVPGATAKAVSKAGDLQALIDAQKGGFQLQPWDWEFYSEQVRKQTYDLDEGQIKPYLELNTVLQDGVFYEASRLYGITFKQRTDIPVYNPDVRVFEVLMRIASRWPFGIAITSSAIIRTAGHGWIVSSSSPNSSVICR